MSCQAGGGVSVTQIRYHGRKKKKNLETWKTFVIIMGCVCPPNVSFTCYEISGPVFVLNGPSKKHRRTEQEISPATKEGSQLRLHLPPNERESSM